MTARQDKTGPQAEAEALIHSNGKAWKFSAGFWTVALKRVVTSGQFHCTTADVSWVRVVVGGTFGSQSTVSVCEPHDLRVIFPRTSTIICVWEHRLDQRFFSSIHNCFCIMCPSNLWGHARSSLFPNIRTKAQRFPVLVSKKKLRKPHQGLCFLDVLSSVAVSGALRTLPGEQQTASLSRGLAIGNRWKLDSEITARRTCNPLESGLKG